MPPPRHHERGALRARRRHELRAVLLRALFAAAAMPRFALFANQTRRYRRARQRNDATQRRHAPVRSRECYVLMRPAPRVRLVNADCRQREFRVAAMP